MDMTMPVTGPYREWTGTRKTLAEFHLRQCDVLAAQARTIWISLLLASTYCWLTIATLDDAQIFVPTKDLALTLVGIAVSPVGFFVAAPVVLLAGFVHFHLTLARFWRFFGDLQRIDGQRPTGIATADRLSPGIVSLLLPGTRAGEFPLLARFVAICSGWVFVPATVFALGYRYLRAHDLAISLFHCLVTAAAIAACLRFRAFACRTLSEAEPTRSTGATLLGTLALALVLALPTTVVIRLAERDIGLPDVLAVNARLHGAAITAGDLREGQKLDAAFRDLALRRICRDADPGDPNAARACREARSHGDPDAAIVALEDEIASLLAAVAPPDIGFVPPPHAPRLQDEGFCAEAGGLLAPRPNFRLADLRQANLVRAGLRCLDLAGADLRGARLVGAQLFGAALPRADLGDAHLEGADLRFADLTEARLVGAHLGGADLWRAVIVNADLFGADLSAARLAETALVGSRIDGTRFGPADLRAARFEASYIRRADLGEAILACAARGRCAGFLRSYLDGVRFGEADVTGLDLAGSALRNIDLRAVRGLTTEQLATAFGDASVLLPEGVARPATWCRRSLGERDFFRLWRGNPSWHRAHPAGPAPEAADAAEPGALGFLAPTGGFDPYRPIPWEGRGDALCRENPIGRHRPDVEAPRPLPARLAAALSPAAAP